MQEDVTADIEALKEKGRSRTPEAHPTLVGPYKLLSLLGEGGFGSVYLAEQTAPVQRRVALKLIKPGMDSRAVIARLEAERQALALMDHPSVAKVFDAGLTEHGRPFFVMEFVRGEPITRYCELERLSVEARVALMIQVCGAVQHAHMKGVLHRDLKPSNILVAHVDGEPLAKVIDFGVAKALHQRLSDTTIYTEIGQMIGTPEYMSPEQARGSTDVDTRADIYALGAILYELLTGVTPVDLHQTRAEGHLSVERTIQEVQPAAPSQRLSQLAKAGLPASMRTLDAPSVMKLVRGDLDWIVLKCLEKERSRRYDSAASLAEDLERYLKDEPVLAGPPSAVYRATKFVRRHRVAVTAAFIVLFTLIGGVIGTTYGLAKAVQEANAAQRARDESEAVTRFLTTMMESVQPDESGRDVTVREVLDQSLLRLERSFTDQPLVEARVRLALGTSYQALGQLHEAERQLPRVVDIREQKLGPDHVDTLRAVHNLASLRLEQGRHAEAEELFSRAVTGMTKVLGEDHPDTLGSMNNLAVLMARRNAHAEALDLFRKVYETRLRVSGPDHPHTLGALSNYADQLVRMERLDEAEPLLRQAVAEWQRAHGPDKPGTLTAMHALAMLQMDRKQYDSAVSTMTAVVDARTRIFGESHSETLGALANLGLIHSKKGMIAEAEESFVKAWRGMRDTLGHTHPKTLTVLSLLSGVLEEQGWPERTRPIVQEIVETARVASQRSQLPPSEMNNLAWLLLHVEPLDLREPNLALQLATRACEMERTTSGRDLWMFLDTLASAQFASGLPREALISQREAIQLIPPLGEQFRGEMEDRAREYESAAIPGSTRP